MSPTLAALLCVAACCSACCSAAFTIGPAGDVVDAFGRTRLFHGVNAVEKAPPFLPPTGPTNTVNSLGPDDAAQLAALGLNVVRLGVLWQGTFPDARGIVNATYLSDVRATISLLNDAGIATIVDMHQDVLARTTCGEGLPPWAHDLALQLAAFDANSSRAFPWPLPYPDLAPDPATGVPPLEACQSHGFGEYYLTAESQAAFSSLYAADDMIAAFAEHWAAVAAALKGAPGLLAYELINEPMPAVPRNGSAARALSDAAVLLPLYDAVHQAIRENDNATIVMFEPLVLDSYEGIVGRSADFPKGGLGGGSDPQQMFAFHSYCPSNPDGSPSGMEHLCPALVAAGWVYGRASAARVGLGGFLTEFGAVGDDPDSVELIQRQLDGADASMMSWTYWTYKSFDDITTQNGHTETFFDAAGALQGNKVAALARPFARAVAGAPLRTDFDTEGNVYVLEFAAAAGLGSALTEITAPGIVFPGGVDVSVSPPAVTWTFDGGVVVLDSSAVAAGTVVACSVRAAAR